MLRAYAFDIAKLDAFAAMYNDLMLGDSGLSKLEREMIAVAVSAENRCFYCLVAHGAAVRQLSGDPALGEALVMNYRVAPLEPRQRAMLDFAVLMTNASATIEERHREALRAHGFSDRDIWDIAAVAILLQHVEPHGERDRHAPERGIPRPGALRLSPCRGTGSSRRCRCRRSRRSG